MPNPNLIETWRYQDIQIPDVALRQQFENYMGSAQYDKALDLLTTNADQLKGKAYVADAINKIVSGVIELEDKFNQGVLVYLSDLALKYSELIDSIKNVGAWDDTKQYEPYNFVIVQDSVYICIKTPPIGTQVSDATYWLKLGLKGLKGASGINVETKYNWNRTTHYVVNDLVAYKNNLYVALKSSVNIAPDTDTASWLLFVSYEKGKIYVGDTAPNNPIDNMVWFQTDVSVENAPATTPIMGKFNRYKADMLQWEIMYPATVYQLVAHSDEYANATTIREATIQPSDWIGDRWIYPVPALTENSVVDILPIPPLSPDQDKAYGKLDIQFEGINIVLTTDKTPVVPLNIYIRIIT